MHILFISERKTSSHSSDSISALMQNALPSSYCAKFKFHLPLVCQFISKREDQSANYVSCLSFIYLFLMCFASKTLPSPLHMCFFKIPAFPLVWQLCCSAVHVGSDESRQKSESSASTQEAWRLERNALTLQVRVHKCDGARCQLIEGSLRNAYEQQSLAHTLSRSSRNRYICVGERRGEKSQRPKWKTLSWTSILLTLSWPETQRKSA